MRVVVDTNVWVSGLILPDSQPGRVLSAIRKRRIDVVTSWELAEEIAEVLRRPKIRLYRITESDVQDVLFLLAPFLPAVDIDVPLRDPDGAPVVAAAVHGRAQAIVTGDRDLLADPSLTEWLAEREIDVLDPSALLELIGGISSKTDGI